jgi:hypothetical protein
LDVLQTGRDTQPNALLVGILILFVTEHKKINGPLIALWSLFIISLLFAFNSHYTPFGTFKAIVSYLSPALIAFTTYNILLSKDFKITYKFFLFVMFSYFFVGVVQEFIYPNFMSFILASARGVHMFGRGVISLTNEPSFYGIQMLLFIVFSLMHFDRKKNLFLVPFAVVQIFFLAKTTTAIGLLGLSFGIFCVIQVLRRKLLYVFILLFSIVAGLIAYNSLMKSFEDTRFGKIAEEFIQDPLKITQVDASASLRLTSTFAPFIAIKENYFMPFGYGRFNDFRSELYYKPQYRKLIDPYILDHPTKMGGGLNNALFHFGFLGLLLPLAIFFAFQKKIHRPEFLFGFILFVLILTTIQLSNSIVGFIIGYTLYNTTNLEEKSIT